MINVSIKQAKVLQENGVNKRYMAKIILVNKDENLQLLQSKRGVIFTRVSSNQTSLSVIDKL